MIGRNEWKYIVDRRQEATLAFRLSTIMEKDIHAGIDNCYLIHSLYFDNKDYECAFDTEAGLNSRYKWRIRYYDDNIEKIFLEKKSKKNGICYKKSCLINKEIYNDIIKNNVDNLLFAEDRLLSEFAVEIKVKGFRPSLIIDYKREVYVELISNTRITFDGEIVASRDIENFLNSNHVGIPILDKNKKVLEVKFDEILPNYIHKTCEIDNMNQVAFSKYNIGFNILSGGKSYESIRNNY